MCGALSSLLQYDHVHRLMYLRVTSDPAAGCLKWQTGRCCSWKQVERSPTWLTYPHSNRSRQTPTWIGIMRVCQTAGSVAGNRAPLRPARDWAGAVCTTRWCTAEEIGASSTCGRKWVRSALWDIFLLPVCPLPLPSFFLYSSFFLFIFLFFCILFTFSILWKSNTPPRIDNVWYVFYNKSAIATEIYKIMISGSHDGEYKDCSFLGCITM